MVPFAELRSACSGCRLPLTKGKMPCYVCLSLLPSRCSHCQLGQSPLAKFTVTSPPSGPTQDAFCPKNLSGGIKSLPFLDSEDVFFIYCKELQISLSFTFLLMVEASSRLSMATVPGSLKVWAPCCPHNRGPSLQTIFCSRASAAPLHA